MYVHVCSVGYKKEVCDNSAQVEIVLSWNMAR